MAGMSNPTSPLTSSVPMATSATSASAEASSGAARFFAALGNPLRWEMVKLLARNGPMCATQVAEVLKRDFDGVSKHLRVLREGGVVQTVTGQDRRLVFFAIPSANQPEPGLLDYGLLKVDLRAPAEPSALRVRV